MSKFEPVIKWSGSKRSQAEMIIKEFPSYNRYYEPFIGGGSILYAENPEHATCGDICEPLIGLWNEIKSHPTEVIDYYSKEWLRLQNDGYEVFYEIRERFNNKKDPLDLLFLSRTCVNGLIRFNANGDFNNSFHHTRKGIAPDRFEKIVKLWSERIKNVEFIYGDYRITTSDAKQGDLVYLDPPYANTKGRYYGTINYDEFYEYLELLNRKNIKFALSFDGKRKDKSYEVDIPKDLYKRQLMLPSGSSSFKKVMDKENEQVYEALYLNW